MKAAIKKKWLKALRSGEYVQTRGILCRIDHKGDHAFCCLGVLINETKGFDRLPKLGFNNHARCEGSRRSLSFQHQKEFGLTEQEHDKLITMNDQKRNRFTTIANWIEKNL